MSEENLPTEQSQASQAARLPPPHVDPRRSGHHQGQAVEGSPPPVGLIWRVGRRETFEALRRGRRGREGPITVSWVPGDPAEPPRVAYAVGRRVGGAVARNRVRRRLRMLIREQGSSLPAGAYLVGAGPGVADLDYSALRAALTQALHHVRAR